MSKDTYPFQTKTNQQVSAIKANDDATLKALYQDNYIKTEKYVLSNNGSAEQAKDIYQEAFIAVWRNIQLDKFSPENEKALAGYLFRIAKNKWLDYLRSSDHKKITLGDDGINGLEVEDVLPEEESEYLAAVKNNFNQLGDNCKAVLTKFYYYKQPLKAIAKTFDWTEATARNNKYRCLQRLKELMKIKTIE